MTHSSHPAVDRLKSHDMEKRNGYVPFVDCLGRYAAANHGSASERNDLVGMKDIQGLAVSHHDAEWFERPGAARETVGRNSRGGTLRYKAIDTGNHRPAQVNRISRQLSVRAWIRETDNQSFASDHAQIGVRDDVRQRRGNDLPSFRPIVYE